MDVRCERCREGYVVDDARVPEAGVKVACPKCGHGFLLKKRVLAVAVPLKAGDGETPVPVTDLAPAGDGAVPPGVGADRAEWRLRKGSGAVFPFRELSTLQRWIVERKAAADDQVAAAGADEDWRRLGDIPELRSFFAVLASPSRDEPTRPVIPPSPGTDDPAWAQDPGPPPGRVTGSLPPLPRRRRRIVWVALLALGLLAVAAATVFLRRKADADVISQATAGALPVPPARAVKPVEPASPSAAPSPATIAAVPAAVPDPVPAPTPDPGTVSPSGPPLEGGATAVPAPPVAPTPVAPTPVARAAPKDDAGGALRSALARAREQRERGRCEAALDLYGQALAIDGRNATALAGRGACYLDLSRYAQAEASFEGALDSDPRNAEALFGLAETYRYMGRKAEAVAGYEEFLAVRPTGDDAAAARRLISQLKE
jgi:predicted Zn finger-like uncharacterized protein